MASLISRLFRQISAHRSSSLGTDTTRGLFFAIAVGVVAGLGAVIFRWLIYAIQSRVLPVLLDSPNGESSQSIFAFLGDYYIVFVPAIGGLVVGPLIYFFAREAKGHGVPEVMVAVIQRGGRIRPVVALVKILASALCIGTGGSVGREGPIVQIGATFGSAIAQRFRLPDDWIRNLVACGAAGGISATFNAPIAGVFFALEVILGRFTTRHFSVVVFSSVVAAVVSHAFFQDEASLNVTLYDLQSPLELPLYAVLGVLAALIGIVFIVVLYRSEDLFERLKFPEYFKPVLGGLMIGLLGLYSTDLLGVGYAGIEAAVRDPSQVNISMATQTALILMGLKVLATSITIGSGGSGGVFAPSLFIGAMLGYAFGNFANDINILPGIELQPGAYAIVGMASVFAAAARAPITSIIILFELTNDYKIILPLMLAVVISTVIAQSLYPESIYTKKMHMAGVRLPSEEAENGMHNVLVQDVMTTDFPTVASSMSVEELWKKFETSEHRGFPVVNGEGELEGVVTVGDVEKAYRQSKRLATASDIATRAVVAAYPDQSVHDALRALGAKEVGRIPVVSRDNPRKLVGILRRHDIIRAYTRSLHSDEE